MKPRILLFFFFVSFSFIYQTAYSQDTDGDGTANNLDQDEDNDGIPDKLDGCSTSDIANTIGIGTPIVTNSSYTIDETTVTYTTTNTTAFYGYVAGNQGDAIRIQGPDLFSDQMQMSFSAPVKNLTFKLTDFDNYEEITVNAYDQTNSLINLTATNVPFLGSFVARSGNLIEGTSTGTNSDGDDDADDLRGAAYFYFPNEVSRIEFDVYYIYSGSIRLTEFNYCLKDTDNDGVLDFLDIDSDNDGIPDTIESGGVDTDGDGYVDNTTDNNGNGIPDIYDYRCTNGFSATGHATNVDGSNNTTNPNNALNAGDLNYANINSSGTLELQFTDIIPAGNNIVIRHERFSGTSPISFSVERSLDGITYFNSETFLTSFNGSYEVLSYDLIGGDTQYIKITNLTTETLGIDYAKYNFGANSNCSGINGQQILNFDTDNDGLTNAQDLDSDGDGVFDIIEANSIDSDGNGLADGYTDSDGDGYNDNYDGDVGNDGIAENSASALITTGADTDSDGIPNSYNNADTDNSGFPNPFDIDSDDDGIPDNIEAQPTIGYVQPNLVINANGLDTAYLSGITPEDTDSDGIPDYQDANSDDDGTLDILENGDVNALSNVDLDLDGLDDAFDSNTGSYDVNDEITTGNSADMVSSFGDTDGDILTGGNLDYRDLFDTNPPDIAALDFDGIDDYVEVPTSVLNSLDEFTISFWIKPETLPTGNAFDTRFIIGQKNMFEIILGPGSDNTPRIWTKHHYDTGLSSNGVGILINDTEWMHFTVSVNYITEVFKIYVNGDFQSNMGMNGTRLTNTNPFRIGSNEDTQPAVGENFDGWLDEVRIFDTILTADQIQRMVYQEIEDNAGFVKGSLLDKDIFDSTTTNPVPWTNLLSYYSFNNLQAGKVVDLSTNNNVATIHNMTTLQPQTAPMPYETVSDGPWTTEGTWLHGDVWDIEDVTSNKDWSIVHIHNDVTTSSSHTQLGMFIDTGNKLTVVSDNSITNSWYLQLDGTLDLGGDSQLIQTENSDLVTSATGKILRRQEGNSSVYWYNYWSSPVGSLGVTTLSDNNTNSNNGNNTPFNIDMIKGGNGMDITFTSSFDNVGQISNRWLYSYLNGRDYYGWSTLTPGSAIAPGVGYTQKGTGVANVDGDQEYIFEGKPNNGTILIQADDVDGDTATESDDGFRTTTFVGNPYPSALDARQFIADNSGVIGGTVYVWEQWGGNNHILEDYQGGYGTINNATTEVAYQFNDPSPTPTGDPLARKPTFYIPVGQGFFVEVVNDGNNAVLSTTDDIEFNNGQRVFIKESDIGDGTNPNNGSIFFRNAEAEPEVTENQMGMIRLELTVSNGNKRRFVLAFSDFTTDGFDYGYDARTIDPENDDMNSFIGNQKMLIQSFSPITQDKEIDLVFNSTGSNDYTLEIVEINGIDDNQDIYLRDNLTGNYHDLRDGASFSSDVNGEDSERFDVVFKNDETLDVDTFDTSSVLIYNNSLEHKLYVKGLDQDAKALTLTNMLGQTVKRFYELSVNELENGLFIGDLSAGVYMVNLVTDDNIKVDKKIILE